MARKKVSMVTLRCDAIPTLLITTPHVQFEDGLATVQAADAEISSSTSSATTSASLPWTATRSPSLHLRKSLLRREPSHEGTPID